MKAFGANADDVSDCASPGRRARGSATVMIRPPLAAIPVLRNARRPRRDENERLGMSGFLMRIRSTPSHCRAMNRGPNALIGATSADIAAHRGIDVGIAWLRHVRKQRGCRHDLT